MRGLVDFGTLRSSGLMMAVDTGRRCVKRREVGIKEGIEILSYGVVEFSNKFLLHNHPFCLMVSKRLVVFVPEGVIRDNIVTATSDGRTRSSMDVAKLAGLGWTGLEMMIDKCRVVDVRMVCIKLVTLIGIRSTTARPLSSHHICSPSKADRLQPMTGALITLMITTNGIVISTALATGEGMMFNGRWLGEDTGSKKKAQQSQPQERTNKSHSISSLNEVEERGTEGRKKWEREGDRGGDGTNDCGSEDGSDGVETKLYDQDRRVRVGSEVESKGDRLRGR